MPENFRMDMAFSLMAGWVEERINSFIEISIQLFVCEGRGWLMKRIGKPYCADILKVTFQNVLCGLETQERIVDRHGKVTGCVVFDFLDGELSGQDLIDLRG